MTNIDRFLNTYKKLDKDSLDLLSDIYADQIRFVDPVHRIDGLENLRAYFQALYLNVSTIAFDFDNPQTGDEHIFVPWQMRFSHPRLGRGRTIDVPGISQLRFNAEGKACFHRDYFDLGALLYEHLPGLGGVVRMAKKRLGR